MAHPVDIYVGQRVRQRRSLLGMTTQQLADSVGITDQQIQNYETGADRISASRRPLRWKSSMKYPRRTVDVYGRFHLISKLRISVASAARPFCSAKG